MLLRGSNASVQGGTARRGQGARSRAYPEGTCATSNAAIVDAGLSWGDGTYAKVHLLSRFLGPAGEDRRAGFLPRPCLVLVTHVLVGPKLAPAPLTG